jgi:hypothetical protein
MSSWEAAESTSQGQDHVLHHTRGFGVALGVLVNYLSSEYGNTFELGTLITFFYHTNVLLFYFNTTVSRVDYYVLYLNTLSPF